MIKDLLVSLRAIVVLTAITSVAYPLAVTAIAQIVFPTQANGSLIKRGDAVAGSALLAQKFTEPGYFWPRPSAADYATVASGASNQGPTSQKLQAAVEERRTVFGADAPADLLTASGSGLDPDISVEAARFQVPRVAAARGLAPEVVLKLVNESIAPPQFGFLGQARVNVLELNLKLDAVAE
jgi:K+-transporting ATPase ATPase C chain